MNTIINIGRQFGSGGGFVAKAIGEKLGIKVYDNELISKAAEESGFSKELFKLSVFTRIGMSSFFAPWRYEVSQNYVNDDALFKIQSDVIREIASKDSAIIIGRCSDYILRDMKCLDVFISAPLEYRIKRVADREKMSEDDARALIAKKDRTRETYYNYFTFGNWGMASNYDLCVDSSILGIEGTADLIIEVGKKMGIIR